MTIVSAQSPLTVPRRPAARRAPRPSARLIADAVVANYIHDISQRHQAPRTRGASERTSSKARPRPSGCPGTTRPR